MANAFDPYYKWLGIAPKDQPPNHYRLLGIDIFEADLDVISLAADQRMAHVRTFQTGQSAAISQKLLNEISAARICLLNPAKKAEYDRRLRAVDAGLRQKKPVISSKPAAVRDAPLSESVSALEGLADDFGTSGRKPRSRSAASRKKSDNLGSRLIAGTVAVILGIAGLALWSLTASPKSTSRATSQSGSPLSSPASTSRTRTSTSPPSPHEKPPNAPRDSTAPVLPVVIEEPAAAQASPAKPSPMPAVVSTAILAADVLAVDKHAGRTGIAQENNVYTLTAASQVDPRRTAIRFQIRAVNNASAGEVAVDTGDGNWKPLGGWNPGSLALHVPDGGWDRLVLSTIDGLSRTRQIKVRFTYQGAGQLLDISEVQWINLAPPALDVPAEMSPSSDIADEAPTPEPKATVPKLTPEIASRLLAIEPAMAYPNTPPNRRPLPDTAAREQARKQIRDLMKEEIKAAKSIDARIALAEKLKAMALDTKSDYPMQFVLFEMAASASTHAGVACTSIDELAARFAVDTFELKADQLDRIAKESPPASTAGVADCCLTLVRESAAVDRLDVTPRFLAAAKTCAAKAKDRKLGSQIADHVKDVERLRKAWDQFRAAATILQVTPDEPAANLTVGRYFSFSKADWDRGLPFLALGADEPIKDVAARELVARDSANEWFELANDWWNVAATEKAGAKPAIMQHAASLYSRSLSGLDLNQASWERRLSAAA